MVHLLMRRGTLPGHARVFADLVKSQLARKK
jgi:hypothetical protein